MKIFCNDKIDAVIDIENTSSFDEKDRAKDIVREIYDNEYFVVNLFVLGDQKSERLDIDYTIDSLANNLNQSDLPHDVEIVTVLNRDIVSSDGYKSTRDIMISNERLTPIYIGIDTSYLGDESNITFTLRSASAMDSVKVSFMKNGHMLHNKGADKSKKFARLQWLNSTLFQNNKHSYIYNDIDIEGNIIHLHGKDVVLGQDGYIKNVKSYLDDNLGMTDSIQNELLDGGISLVVSDDVTYNDCKIERNGANIIIHAVGEGENVSIINKCTVKYEGAFYYEVQVIAKRDTIIDVEQISTFSNSASKYMSGLGMNGGLFKAFDFKWNKNHEDSLFIGDINIGARIRWQDETDDIPFNKNLYRYKPMNIPASWDNEKKGGINVLFERERARVNAYTGKVSLTTGEKRVYRFSVHLTPFHEIKMSDSFGLKRYENNKSYNIPEKKLFAMAEKSGANRIVLHNNKEVYKYLNYPIKKADELKNFNEHNKHIGVELYYNLKDISIKNKDVMPFNYMGDVIFKSADAELQKNVSDDLREKLGKNALMCYKSEEDASAMVNPKSRYNNYYIEMVNWLAKECNIKGIMLDDPLMDRITIERMRKAIDRYKGSIECILANTNNNKMGMAHSLNNNAEILPFLDKIVIGKGYNMKNMSPYELLIDASGIPYGMSAECLDTDVFLGMLYGMYNRAGYNQNSNKKLNKLLDRFDIKNSRMVGFWSHDALHAKDDGIKITYYVNDKKALICMYNFNNYPAVSTVDYSPLKIKGIMKSYPMSKIIMHQKFNTNTTVVLYNKCGVFIEADLD